MPRISSIYPVPLSLTRGLQPLEETARSLVSSTTGVTANARGKHYGTRFWPPQHHRRLRSVRYNAMGVRGGIWSDRDHDDIAFVALSDLEHIRTGWLLFETGLPPDLHWDASLGQPGPRPGKGHKRGLCLRLFFPEAGIGLRELTTNNAGVCAAIDKIYSEFEFAPERAQGLVPLVECTDVISSETSFGAIFDPVLAIVGWRPRPHELAPPPPAAKNAPQPPPRPPTLALGRDLDVPF
jgi:hypothetical protein